MTATDNRHSAMSDHNALFEQPADAQDKAASKADKQLIAGTLSSVSDAELVTETLGSSSTAYPDRPR